MQSKKIIYLCIIVSVCFVVVTASFIFDWVINGWNSANSYSSVVILTGVLSILVWAGYVEVHKKNLKN